MIEFEENLTRFERKNHEDFEKKIEKSALKREFFSIEIYERYRAIEKSTIERKKRLERVRDVAITDTTRKCVTPLNSKRKQNLYNNLYIQSKHFQGF